ncbi:hypothetical protein SeMB42_g07736 [Synchytrium endobioticum]|uniref:Uncharacterized protein n=1 Tax=Synchytrium endobioticum TaxID=286115 RepID=A0A507BWU1_9FUNG|nr:hypothetical protein SeMB42_g07736 [Synchytrium endobioticum]
MMAVIGRTMSVQSMVVLCLYIAFIVSSTVVWSTPIPMESDDDERDLSDENSSILTSSEPRYSGDSSPNFVFNHLVLEARNAANAENAENALDRAHNEYPHSSGSLPPNLPEITWNEAELEDILQDLSDRPSFRRLFNYYFLATYLAAASRVFNFSQRGSQKFGSETSTSYAAIDSIGSIGNSIIRNCQHSLVAASPSFNHRHQLSPLGGGWMYLVPSRQPYIVKYGGARLRKAGSQTAKQKFFAS